MTAIDVDATKAGEAVNDLGAAEFVTFADATGEGPNSKKSEFDVILNTASGKIDTAKLMDMLKPDGTLIQVRESRVCGVINHIRICMHACVCGCVHMVCIWYVYARLRAHSACMFITS